MMSELENQTKKKSREKSGENADTSGGKKKEKKYCPEERIEETEENEGLG